MGTYRIVVADDHALFRQGLKGILAGAADLEVVGEAGDGLELLNLLNANQLDPHLVILDISMPNLRGIEAIREIKTIHPNVKILILPCAGMHCNPCPSCRRVMSNDFLP